MRPLTRRHTPYALMVRRLERQIDGLWAGWEAALQGQRSPTDMADFSWLACFPVAQPKEFEKLPDPPPTSPPRRRRNRTPATGGARRSPSWTARRTASRLHPPRVPDGELLIVTRPGDIYSCMIRQPQDVRFPRGQNVQHGELTPPMIFSSATSSYRARLLILQQLSTASNVTTMASFNPRGVPGMFGIMIGIVPRRDARRSGPSSTPPTRGRVQPPMFHRLLTMHAFRAAQLATPTVPNAPSSCSRRSRRRPLRGHDAELCGRRPGLSLRCGLLQRHAASFSPSTTRLPPGAPSTTRVHDRQLPLAATCLRGQRDDDVPTRCGTTTGPTTPCRTMPGARP